MIYIRAVISLLLTDVEFQPSNIQENCFLPMTTYERYKGTKVQARNKRKSLGNLQKDFCKKIIYTDVYVIKKLNNRN